MKYTLIIAFFFFSFSGVAQTTSEANEEENPRYAIGFTAGYYLAGEEPIGFYSGLDNNRLGLLFSSNTDQYRAILNSLDGYPFALQSGPSDIIYKNTASFELTGSYLLPKEWSINLSVHNVRLDVSGIFTVKVDRTNPTGAPEPFLELGEIRGQETRSHIALTLGKSFPFKNNFYTKVEGGLDLNFVEAISNKVSLAGREYNIFQIISLTQRAQSTTTVGTGLHFNASLGYQLKGGYGAFIKIHYFNTKINVNNISESQSSIVSPSIGFMKLL